jgi:NADH:ubiquinone reductase (H+-translocating)
MENNNMKVVIIGGGFAGVQAALDLANQDGFDVRLISDKNYFEYHAALYRSATGRSPLEVAVPLAELFESAENVEVVQDKIVALDSSGRTVSGESESVYHYDALILALGNITNYYGIPGLQEYSFGVKSIQESLEFKRHLHESIVTGQIGEKNYVIVGGGATGCELAGELSTYIKNIRQKHQAEQKNINIDLVEAAPRLLPAMPEDFAARVTKRLQELGIKVYTNTKVESETYEALNLPSGPIQSHTVVWTAGAANHPFYSQYPKLFPTDKKGRVVVNEYLEASPGIYVLGDSAATKFSGMAQTALHDAHFVARNLLAKARGLAAQTYVPKQPAYAIPAGPHWAGALIGNQRFYGIFGSIIRRLVDLRLFLRFLPLRKALFTWQYGFKRDEACPVCNSVI